MDVSVISAPAALGLSPNPRRPDRPRGTWRAPRALISAGLVRGLSAEDAGEVAVEPYQFGRDAETGIYNRAGLARQAVALAGAVGPAA